MKNVKIWTRRTGNEQHRADKEISEKLLNEWGINNAKSLGLEACTIATVLLARAEAAEKERDAAVEDIRLIAPCSLCKNNGKQPCKNEDAGHEKCFDWRGTKDGQKGEEG